MTPVLAEIQAFPNQFFVDELPRGGTEQERTRLRDPFLRLSSRLPGNSTAAPPVCRIDRDSRTKLRKIALAPDAPGGFGEITY